MEMSGPWNYIQGTRAGKGHHLEWSNSVEGGGCCEQTWALYHNVWYFNRPHPPRIKQRTHF